MKVPRRTWVSIAVGLVVGAAITIWLQGLHGCSSPQRPAITGCVRDTTRCNGEIAQLCTPSGRWEDNMDCRFVQPVDGGWTCGVSGGEHTCVRAGGTTR
jgi:hypothetical protein